ncbi:MAG: hydroxyethylthiazole kinase [Magnetococcales bacterium]|nr:hydroxyethylthiazole kinase [Magnetococcales bacterium]
MIWQDIEKIRGVNPLVHNITNYVVMNSSANALLALGASPVMAHAIDEVDALVDLAAALVINIGTLSSSWIDAMLQAGRRARVSAIPVVLDPVGSGTTQFRTSTSLRLIEETHPAVIRGNASEIRALNGVGATTKGVDSQHTPDQALDDARQLSTRTGCIVSVSGPVDLIVDGNGKVARVANGNPMMTKVTGMGCTSSAITGAFLAVNQSAFESAVNAMAIMGIAGEMAAEQSAGPGSLQFHFLDALYRMKESDISHRLKIDYSA